MRKYDLTLLVKSAEGVEAKLEKLVKALDGRVDKTVSLGKKPLAYEIKKQTTGEYLSSVVELPAASVLQLGRKLVIEEQRGEILRHLLVAIED